MLLAALLRLVQLDLQVPDVVDDVLQDLHLARLLVGWQSGHQLLQFAVAAVHVLQEDVHLLVQQRDLAFGNGQALLGQADLSADLALQGAGRSDNLHLVCKLPQMARLSKIRTASRPLKRCLQVCVDSSQRPHGEASSAFYGKAADREACRAVPFEERRPMRGAPKPRCPPMSALRRLSEFTICLRDGVTNGNKCVSFMGNMWESSCPRLGDSAGVDCLGTVNAGPCAVRMCVGWDGVNRMNA